MSWQRVIHKNLHTFWNFYKIQDNFKQAKLQKHLQCFLKSIYFSFELPFPIGCVQVQELEKSVIDKIVSFDKKLFQRVLVEFQLKKVINTWKDIRGSSMRTQFNERLPFKSIVLHLQWLSRRRSILEKDWYKKRYYSIVWEVAERNLLQVYRVRYTSQQLPHDCPKQQLPEY